MSGQLKFTGLRIKKERAEEHDNFINVQIVHPMYVNMRKLLRVREKISQKYWKK